MAKNVTVYIASHYLEAREKILGAVLDAMADWQDVALDVTVMSNVSTYRDTKMFSEASSKFGSCGFDLKLEVVDHLADPNMLTWEHKKYIPEWAQSAEQGNDFFIYIEDDILITNKNFQYFLSSLELLKPSNLIPGFLRYEYDNDQNVILVDQTTPEYWQRDRTRLIDGKTWHGCVNPYWAGFIFDRDLALEYVSSDSFDCNRSENVHQWSLKARAAMGLTYESPPRDLKTRVVIPLTDGMPDPECFIWHRANNYVANESSPNGKRTPQETFKTETLSAYVVRKSKRVLQKMAG